MRLGIILNWLMATGFIFLLYLMILWEKQKYIVIQVWKRKNISPLVWQILRGTDEVWYCGNDLYAELCKGGYVYLLWLYFASFWYKTFFFFDNTL